MNLLELTRVNIKQILTNPLQLMFLFLLPVGTMIFVTVILGGSEPSANFGLDIAFNIEDSGTSWETIVAPFEKSQEIFINDLDGALLLLEQNKILAVYNIPSEFSEHIEAYKKPLIEVYKREKGNMAIPLETKIDSIINELLEEKILRDNEIITSLDELDVLKTKVVMERNQEPVSGDFGPEIMILIMFIFFGSVSIVTQLMELKKGNILARVITTPNRGGVVIASLIISFFVVQYGINVLVLLGAKMIFDFPIVSLSVVLINFALASLFSITFSLAAIRITKNESIISLLTTIFSLGSTYLVLFANSLFFSSSNRWIENLAKFVPQYWIFESLEEMVLFPNVLIVLLMIAALFSAGCYRLKNFVND